MRNSYGYESYRGRSRLQTALTAVAVILFIILLLAVAFFPGIVVWLCGITGIETPSNLIYLFGILILLLISFYQTALLSKQADRITRLTQVLSIEKFYREQKEADRTDEETTK